uniref:HMA domain-containing protein n=1 Tax=Oryza brachyantha TaxID=4533 RepID=J3L8E4_ORYBR
MASLVLKDLNKRFLGLSCSSAASPPPPPPARHSPPHLRDPARTPSKKPKKSKQQLVSPASSSRFLLNSSRMQPADDSIIIRNDRELELAPPVTAAAEEEKEIAAAGAGDGRETSQPQVQVVVLRVSLHCKGCAGKVKKHISRMEGVTSLDIDIATKKVTVVGDVTPLAVLSTVSKIKPAQFWPTTPTLSSPSPAPPRASASF